MTEQGEIGPPSDREQRLASETLCSEFEDGWSSDPDRESRIERFLARVGEGRRTRLVEELVAVECELWATLGRPADRGSYLERFPRWRDAVDRAFDWWAGTEKRSSLVHATRPGRLGDYRIGREIGRGGMGVVYEAVQESLDRRVAIKTLAAHWANHPDFIRRFCREARAAGSLHHTNIVEVHGAGEQDGLCYYAMQLVEGKPLSRFIQDRTPLPAVAGEESSLGSGRSAAVVGLGVQVARALEYAHGRGVLHRDIKPSNLLVDQAGTAWLADFGLAKVIQEGSDATRTGEMIGSLRYLPPEALDGHWDERGDVYSLGLTLYELLTFRPAFAATDRSVLIHQILRGQPVRPRQIDPAVPRDLETVVLKAIAREPADRYPGAAALADDLQRLLDGKPVAARKASVFLHVWKWSRRNRAAAALILLVNLVAFVGFPTLAMLWRRSEAARTLADRHETSARAARDDAEAVGYASAVQLAQKYVEESNTAEAVPLLARWDPSTTPPGPAPAQAATAHGRDPRDWEWHYLKGRLDQSERTLTGHSGAVHFVAIRPDDAQVATVGGFDSIRGRVCGEVILWDAATWRPRHVLHMRHPRVLGAAYSPDGRWLATIAMKELGLDDRKSPPLGSVELWNTETGALVRELTMDADYSIRLMSTSPKPIQPGVRFTPDGRRLITWPDPVEVWDTGTWRRDWKAPGRASFLLPGDDRLLVVSKKRGNVLDLATGAKKVGAPEPSGLDYQTFDFAESADRAFLSAVVNADRIRVWELPALARYRDVLTPGVTWGAVSPKGDQVVFGDRRGTLHFRPLQGLESDGRLGHKGPIDHGAFSHDGNWLVTAGGMDDTVRVWRLADTRRPVVIETNQSYDSLADIAFAEGGNRISYACSLSSQPNERRCGWRALDGGGYDRRLPTNGFTHWPRTDFAYSPDGRFLAAPALEETTPDVPEVIGYPRSGRINIWRADTLELCLGLAVGPGHITSLAWGSGHARVAVATHDRGQSAVRLFEVADPLETASDVVQAPSVCHAVDSNEVRAMAFDPTGRELAASTSGGLHLWDLSSGNPGPGRHYPGKDKAVFLAYAPDGRRLAAAHKDAGVVRVHDAATGAVIYEIPGPDGVSCARFSPNGRRLALVGSESLVYFCDARTGNRLLTLDGSKSPAGTVGFTPRVIFSADGRRIATNDWQGRVTVWEAEVGAAGE